MATLLFIPVGSGGPTTSSWATVLGNGNTSQGGGTHQPTLANGDALEIRSTGNATSYLFNAFGFTALAGSVASASSFPLLVLYEDSYANVLGGSFNSVFMGINFDYNQDEAEVSGSHIPLHVGTVNGANPLYLATNGTDRWALDGSVGNLTLQANGIGVQAVDSATLRVGGTTVATDVAPGAEIAMAQSAYSQSTVHQTGGSLAASAGLGVRKITIVDHTQCAGVSVSLLVDGILTTKTEPGNWSSATSDAATATSLASSLNAISGMSATAVGSVVYVTKAVGTYSLTGLTSFGSQTGLVMSFDYQLPYNVGVATTGYLGTPSEGKLVVNGLGGPTHLETAPAGWIAYLGPGVLRVSPGVSDSTADTLSFGFGSQAGIQLWPSNDTFTDVSFEDAELLFEFNELQLVTTANGAGRTVRSLRIGTTSSSNGSSTTGANVTFITAGSDAVVIDDHQNVVLAASGSALNTNATNGFTYLPNCAGAPVGTPASLPTGATPTFVDTTNGKLWAYYGGAWHFTALT